MLTIDDLVRWAEENPEDTHAKNNLQDALDAAEAYIQGAGVPDTDSALRDMALRKLALYYYEHRSADERYGYPDPPPDLNALILNVRY